MWNAARVALAAAFCFTAASAMAEPGTKDEQSACKPDVYRLCKDAIPVTDKIVSCLKENRSKLSPSCRKVFSHG